MRLVAGLGPDALGGSYSTPPDPYWTPSRYRGGGKGKRNGRKGQGRKWREGEEEGKGGRSEGGKDLLGVGLDATVLN